MEYSAIWQCSPATFKGFIAMLMFANYKDQKSYDRSDGQEITIPRGSFVMAQETFSQRTGLTRQQTRDCYSDIQNLGIATVRGTRKGTTISILNYERYQKVGTSKGTSKGTNSEPIKNQLRTNSEPMGGGLYKAVKVLGEKKVRKKEGEEGTSLPDFSLSDFTAYWQNQPERDASQVAAGLKAYRLPFRIEEDIYNKIMGDNDGTVRCKSIFEQVAERRRKEGLAHVGGEFEAESPLARIRNMPNVQPET